MTPEMRTRSPAFSACTSASESGVWTFLMPSLPVLTLTAFPRAAPQPRSQRHLFVPMRVTFDFLGGGLRPPSEPPPKDCAGKAGARPSVALLHTRRRPHNVTSLCRCAWHSMVTATGSEVMWHGYVRM